MKHHEGLQAAPAAAEFPGRGAAWIEVAGLLAGLPGCLVGPAYGVYDTNQCYWTWVADDYGGHEQLYCWNPGLGTYREYLYGGSYVRRYPSWYGGPRVVVTPPPVGLVQPPGVVVVPPPPAQPAPAQPAPAQATPWAVPAPH